LISAIYYQPESSRDKVHIKSQQTPICDMNSVKTNVLIVEDNQDAAEALSLLLEMNGYAVSKAADGFEALERLNTKPQTSLIILDLHMPSGMDGKTFLQTIRQDGPFRAIPIIVVSAWGASLTESQSDQVQATVTKPVDPKRLLAILEKLARGESAFLSKIEIEKP
jgi:CheY-like chemotaxis protein